jgi:glyoxylase-like metal-dependent hydrolase (beta-lactamase superfamily II)
MDASNTGEIIEGLWRFEALLPDWTEHEGGEDGWEQSVAWWAVVAPGGLVLIDPLIEDWHALDALAADASGCAGVVRTCYWHQRSVADVVRRYDVPVWARRDSDGHVRHAIDRPISDSEEIFDRMQIIDVERADEVALWLPQQRALVFGDAMIRTRAGELRVCPESWTQPEGGPSRLRSLLADLMRFPVEHVLVSHGPLVLGGGIASLRRAIA